MQEHPPFIYALNVPKTDFDITRFNEGLILDIVKEELPESGLSNNSRNVFSDQSGHLSGFRTHQQLLGGGNVSGAVYSGSFQADRQTHLFHVEQASPPRIKIFNPDGSNVTSLNLPGTLLSGQVTHAQRSDHLYLGCGNRPGDTPAWIGKHKHKQFGSVPSSGFQALPSELFSPTQLSSANSFPRARAVARSGSRTYMISRDTPFVYKFNGTTLEARSTLRFGNPVAICADSVINHVWIFDQLSMTLNRVNSSLEVVSVIHINGIPKDDRIVTDIAVLGSTIWISRDYPEISLSPMQNWLYRVPRHTGNVNVQAVDNSYTSIASDNVLTFEHAIINSEMYLAEVEAIQFIRPRKCFAVSGGNLYVAFRLSIDYQFHYEHEGELYGGQSYAYQNVVKNYTNFWLPGNTVPVGPANTNNLFICRIQETDDPGHIVTSQLNLITNNKQYNAIDGVYAEVTNLYLSNKTHNGQYTRMTVPYTSLTGGNHVSSSVNQITGFADNQIDPILTIDGNQMFWISGNNPPRIGTASTTALTSQVESAANIFIEEIPGGFSEKNKTYWYAFSFIYDEYQESPLSDYVSASADDGFGFIVRLNIPKTNVNRRVSHVNIYRAGGNYYGRQEFFRIVDSIPLFETIPDGTIAGQAVWKIEYNDRKAEFELGPTFEANAGLYETMNDAIANYSLSHMGEDHLFISDFYHPHIDGQALLLRSNPHQFSSFNWELNVARLSSTPVALSSYGGRLFAFDRQRCYVIDPVNMIVENEFDGIGVLSKDAVVSTPAGIFVAGINGFYQITQAGITPLSDRIHLHDQAIVSAFSTTPGVDTKNALRDYRYLAANGSNHLLAYNLSQKYLLYTATISGATIGYLRNMETGAWSRFVKSSYSLISMHCLSDGIIIGYQSGSCDRLFGSTFTSYVAELNPFNGREASVNKWFYQVRIQFVQQHSGVVLRLAIDNGNYSNPITPVNGIYTVPPAQQQGKRLRLYIESSEKITAVTIIYRKRIVRS